MGCKEGEGVGRERGARKKMREWSVRERLKSGM